MTETLTPEADTAPATPSPATPADADPVAHTDTAPADAQTDAHADAHADTHADSDHAHPTDWQYIKIALLLALLTAIEVFTYFESVHNMSAAALYIVLTLLMVLKFAYVAAWFMHLKFDSMIFRRVFQVGIVMALAVYAAMLTAFEIW